MKKRIAIIAAIPAAFLLFILLTVIFIPDSTIKGFAVRALQTQGYALTAARFGKAFPVGIKARGMVISTDAGPLFKADDAVVRLRILPLLIGRVKGTVDAKVGPGTISGEYTPAKGGTAQLSVTRVRLDDIPFFETIAGAKAKGELRVQAAVTGLNKSPAGDVKLEVTGAELAGLKIGGTPLPDAAYRTVQGKLALRGGRATLESFTLQGEGLYVRLKGDFPVTKPVSAAPLNVTLEIMPKPEFLERQKFVFLLLTRYLDTPGHYQIPVRGTLGHPAVF